MAAAEIRPDWTIGTLNLTSGSVDFTTSGSALQTAAIQPGDTIMIKGFVLVIASITGQNAGTLMQPCPAGAAGTGQPLRIRFQPDGSRYNGATAELVQLLSSGNVHSLSEIVGANNTMPYFTGMGTMGQTALTALARTILGRTSGATMYGDLGEIPNGSLPLRIRSTSALTTDLNSITETGFRTVSTTATGHPEPGSAAQLVTIMQAPDVGMQFLYIRTNAKAYSRNVLLGTFSPWVQIGHDIIENSNGTAIRLPGGVQIAQPASVTMTIPANSTLTWTFPAAFSGSPAVIALPSFLTAGFRHVQGGVSPTNCQLTGWNSDSTRTGDTPVILSAIGRY